MLFLKSLWAYGFKSFGEPTKLDFNNEMIGVVGPNGSGKSNITDAIRWALGEQSNKSLRGSKIDDVVFSGSANKKALDKATVKLTFSNDRDTFTTINTDTVEIVRTFDKKRRESEFFINGEKVRLKDVQEVAMETGLTKSSLAIISQGTITNFAGAKPEDRRELFNEAAGVAKYKKRKAEAVAKLIKTQDNLNRINDIVSEILKRLPGLERASKKALVYKEKIAELSEIEINILVKDAKIFKDRIDEISSSRSEFDKQIKELTNEINLSDDEFRQIMSETSEYDQNINLLNAKFTNITNRISDLKVKKVESENRENNSEKNVSLDDFKIKNIKKEYSETKIKLENEKDKIYKLSNSFKDEQERYDYFNDKFDELFREIETIRRSLDRLNNQKLFLQNKNNTESTSRANQMVLDNADRIGGVIGSLLSFVSVDDEYTEAISAASGASMNAILMRSSQDTKRAAEFLRRNPVGRVTFLPLDAMRPTTITGLQRSAIEEAPGFIGFANEIVKIDSQYQVALDYALGTVIVVENYDAASELAKQINYRFNIVTLQGERILPKGAVQAGKNKNQKNIFENKNENNIEDIEKQIDAFENKEFERSKAMQDFKLEKDKVKDKIDDINVQISTSKNRVNELNDKLNDLNDNYRLLTNENIEGSASGVGENESIRIAKEINRLENERDEIQSQISTLTTNKAKFSERQKYLTEVNQDKRDKLNKLKDDNSDIMYEMSALTEKLNNTQMKLLEKYNLTVDSAIDQFGSVELENEDTIRERIKVLTIEISELGQVNLDSIEEYAEQKERFDYYEKERLDIQMAYDELTSIINDMDIAMETQFKKVVDDVNQALPEAFARLFGGGTAELIYTDPDDILNTGIDIKVNPPGKKISNINLLSGGEKSLVALSVLFSILKVRPLPLVVLDEAEAPLDPANVERFARYIKQFTNDTQFIVVTHREGTMENMDTLFGVTMEQKGISKIVNIKLVEAKKLIEND